MSAAASAPSLLPGVRALADDYDAFILDIWGVLHDGIRAFPGTVPCLEKLRAAGKAILLLSNTPDRSDPVAARLTQLGIRPELYDHILTAGESAWRSLRDRNDDFHRTCGDVCFSPGNDFNMDENGHPLFFRDLPLRFTDDAATATFVLNACGGREAEVGYQWDKIREALTHDLPMICVNPDLVVHVGDTLFTCAGTFAKFYEENGGRVVYHGKPHLPVYEMARQLLGRTDKSRIIAIGDSLHTDIQGANRFGIASALNLTGIHRDDEALGETIKNSADAPLALLQGFVW